MNYLSGRAAVIHSFKLLVVYFTCFFVFSMLLMQMLEVPMDHFRLFQWMVEYDSPDLVIVVVSIASILSCITLTLAANFFFELGIRTGVKSLFPEDTMFAFAYAFGVILASVLLILLLDDTMVFSINPLFEFRFSLWMFFFVAAAAEEWVFRLVLFKAIFKTTQHIHFTILLSSLLFAAAHAMNGLPGLGFLNIFLAGVLHCLILIKSRTIIYPMLFHFSWNVLQGLVLGFSVSGLRVPSLMSIEFKEPNSVNGGAFGLEGSCVTAIILFIMVGFLYVNTIARKSRKASG